jgi:hypothetical protein
VSGRRILSDDQLDRMAELREEGWSYARIADHFTKAGTVIHHATIRWQCLRLGAIPPRTPPVNLGKKTAGSKGRAFTEAEDATILRMRGEGAGVVAIGRAIGRPYNSITGRLFTIAYHEAYAEGADQ